MAAEDLDTLFSLPLSQEAFEELETLGQFLELQAFDEESKDTWIYQWGNMTYSSSKLYKLAFQNLPEHSVFSWLWKSKCTPRVKFFASIDSTPRRCSEGGTCLMKMMMSTACFARRGQRRIWTTSFLTALSPRDAGRR
jgi:hypothetical protein